MNLSRSAFLICVTLASAFAADEPPTLRAMNLAREGTTAAAEKNYAKYLEKMQQAVELRPEYPRMLVNLAAALAYNDRPEEAIATLERLAALGMTSPVEKSPAFESLRERKDFKDVVTKLKANSFPQGEGDVAFTIPEMTGLIEGIAWREKTGQFFFGDVHHHCVWVREPAPKDTKGKAAEPKVRRFTPEDSPLLGVFGLVIDEERGVLWAATSALSAMDGYTEAQQGQAGVAEIDLQTGEVKRVVLVPNDARQHAIGDLALSTDGTVWLPDSTAPVLWRLAPGADKVEVFVESDEFNSLQGVVALPDGNTLIVADYPGGLLRVDIGARTVRRLDPPPNAALGGIDGLVRTPEGEFIAIQNGVRPNRVLRLAIDHATEAVTRVDVLEAAHLNMASPSLGCLGPGGQYYFIGNANWAHFDEPGAKASAPQAVPIFVTKLKAEAPAAKKNAKKK
jgi:sugar lactone lactonase YvrE